MAGNKSKGSGAGRSGRAGVSGSQSVMNSVNSTNTGNTVSFKSGGKEYRITREQGEGFSIASRRAGRNASFGNRRTLSQSQLAKLVKGMKITGVSGVQQ